MTKPCNPEFEARWEKASRAPKDLYYKSDNPIVVDLSLDNVLDRYVAAARESVQRNLISPGALDALEQQTQHYKQAVRDLDGGGVLEQLRNFRRRLNPFR